MAINWNECWARLSNYLNKIRPEQSLNSKYIRFNLILAI